MSISDCAAAGILLVSPDRTVPGIRRGDFSIQARPLAYSEHRYSHNNASPRHTPVVEYEENWALLGLLCYHGTSQKNERHIISMIMIVPRLKQESDAFSASKMPKGMSRHETNFGVIVTTVGIRVNGKQAAHGSDGEYLKHRIRMGVVRFLDGTEQVLYHPEGPEHPNAGLFKGCVRSYESMESTLLGGPGKPSVVKALLIVLGRQLIDAAGEHYATSLLTINYTWS
ncbi:hypothetical protein BD779DRAFT_1479063 [Infundibulicybe gibba]|nr:hypothetical protein BD779DRAFT_1479063 [Infundibulicybe gibba]